MDILEILYTFSNIKESILQLYAKEKVLTKEQYDTIEAIIIKQTVEMNERLYQQGFYPRYIFGSGVLNKDKNSTEKNIK